MTKGQLHIENYFSSKVAWTDLDMDLQLIENHCYKLRSENKGRNFSNRDGWQSNDLIFPNILDNTAQTIVNAAATYFKQLKGKKEYDTILQNMWINISPKGAYNIPHVHPNSFLSGVFYIKTPKDCGRIWFIHPSDCVEYDWKKEYWEKFDEGNAPIQYMTVQPKRLYLFPSWLKHGVEQNKSEEDRISVSFNVGIYKK